MRKMKKTLNSCGTEFRRSRHFYTVCKKHFDFGGHFKNEQFKTISAYNYKSIQIIVHYEEKEEILITAANKSHNDEVSIDQ